jgi:hypothetical protein
MEQIAETVIDGERLSVIAIKSNCNISANKSTHPIQIPLLVTEPRTRDSILLSYTQNDSSVAQWLLFFLTTLKVLDILALYFTVLIPTFVFFLWQYSPLDLGRSFKFVNHINSGWDFLDGGSAGGKAATYTQKNTDTE